MLIIQISDCHLYASEQYSGYDNITPYESLSAVLASVKQQYPDLVVCTGDISGDGSIESYQHFITMWQHSGIDCPLKVIAGNHDSPENMLMTFPTECMFDGPLMLENGWFLHGLNSKFEGNLGRVCEKQLANLHSHVDVNSDAPHLVAVHHHPIPCRGWMDTHEFTNRAQFIDAIKSLPQVKGVIYGHIHHASEQRINDCHYMSVPSTCWQWAQQKTFSTARELAGYRVIRLTATEQIDSQVIRIE